MQDMSLHLYLKTDNSAVSLRQDHSCNLKALLKGTNLSSLLLLACGNHTCAPLRIDQDMQGHGLAPDDFSNWHNMLSLSCAADDICQKGTQAVCVMLKCS